MYISPAIVEAVRVDNIANPRPTEPVIKKIKNSSMSGANAKGNVTGLTKPNPVPVKSVNETNKRDSRMPNKHRHKKDHFNRPTPKHEKVATEPKRQPAPIKWRTRNIANGTHAGGTLMWAYKRNYKVELIDSAHGVFPYTVTEITDPQKPKPVLKVVTGNFKDLDEAKDRCENIVRILGRGLDLRLTDNEKQHGEYVKENCKFVEYEQAVPEPAKVTEEVRCTEAEHERILKEKMANMKFG